MCLGENLSRYKMSVKTEYYRSKNNLYKKVLEKEIIGENLNIAVKNEIVKETLYKYDFNLGAFCIVPKSDYKPVGSGLYWQISYFAFQVFLLYWKIFR